MVIASGWWLRHRQWSRAVGRVGSSLTAMGGARSDWSTCRASGARVVLVWRKRTWRCAEFTCPAGSFAEQQLNLVGRRAC